MEPLDIPVQRLDPRATLPTYSSPGAAGADLYALLDGPLTIAPGETALVHTGLAMAIPEGWGGFLFARSGLATKTGLAPANKVGVIDADYRGEVLVALHNHSHTPAEIRPNQRIAQLVLLPTPTANFPEHPTLPPTPRNTGGFGSTGE